MSTATAPAARSGSFYIARDPSDRLLIAVIEHVPSGRHPVVQAGLASADEARAWIEAEQRRERAAREMGS